MQKIRKAVIPAAGLGTRFLPVTKAVPKELLPIVDVPTLELIIREAAASGIEKLLLVVSDSKDAIRRHFTPDPALEAHLYAHGKDALATRIADVAGGVELSYVVQEEPLGLGHAVSLARDFACGEPLAVLLGDDLVHAEPPVLAQLMDVYDKTGATVIGVQPVAEAVIHKYGIVAPQGAILDGHCRIKNLVEKPAASDAPSNLAILGRYIVTPEIFDILDATAPGKGGEIQLTDALNTLAAQENMQACVFTGRRYDVGDQLGFIEANIEYGLRRADIGDDLKAYLKELTTSLD